MDHFWILMTVVATFATVQSLFGVGLLVFGTPTLLLLGYPFDSTIAALLPASMTISILQVIAGRHHLAHAGKDILVYCAPGIVLGLWFVLTLHAVEMKLIVGMMLVATAFMRCHETTRAVLGKWVKKHSRVFMMTMGLIHGLSNMGGGLLTVLASSTHDEKDTIRANIAYGYLLFAGTQLAVLALVSPAAFSIHSISLALLSLVTYVTVGHVLYRGSPKVAYQSLITVLLFAYGVVLLCQRFA
jgi:uncharacterized membrane protein YfcA